MRMRTLEEARIEMEGCDDSEWANYLEGLVRRLERQSLSQESVRSEALQKRENEIWEEVVESCLRAWPGENVFYDQSPLELIIRLINERDAALQSPARVAEDGEPELCCQDFATCRRPCTPRGIELGKSIQKSSDKFAYGEQKDVHSTELRK